MYAKRTVASRKRKSTRTNQRPPGTRLTEEQKLLIATAIEAGATDYVAAEVAGISARSFRELRQRAEGRARMKAEIEIADRDAKHWLRYRAPSKPGLDGWTAPVPEEPESVELGYVMSADELREVVTTLVVSGAVPLARCGDPSCTCRHHAPVSEGGYS